MHTEFDQGRLISTMAFALRHDPNRFGLDLDDEGWTSIADLIIAIRFERYDWALIDESFVRATIAGMDRFEVRDGRIRAVYGHSVELATPPAVVTPPALLFHGTAADNVSSILQQGILRMRRRFAHFSTDYQWVVQFLSDKPAWTIFAIDVPRAHASGVAFRKANHHVWLADSMDPQFLPVHSQGSSSRVGHS
jgi:putative RNA 2'-phosphotransferase